MLGGQFREVNATNSRRASRCVRSAFDSAREKWNARWPASSASAANETRRSRNFITQFIIPVNLLRIYLPQ
jgi:hypothetical protein